MDKQKTPKVTTSGGYLTTLNGLNVMSLHMFKKIVGKSRKIDPIVWNAFICKMSDYVKEFTLLPREEVVKYIINMMNMKRAFLI